MSQYQSPINALLSQLPQLAMQMYGASREDKYRAETASREDKYRAETASREDKYRDKEMQFQKNNAAFSQGIQNRNADIAEDNAEQARLSAIAQRNLYAEQLLVAKQTREANDPNTVMFENENSSSPIGITLNQGTKNYDNFTKPVYNALLNGANDRRFKNPEVIAQLGLLQGALESDYGNSAPGNNIFGIKSATGTSRDTKEFVNGKEVSVKQNFGDYATPADSVDSYLDLIQNSKYYGGIRDARTIGDAIASTGKYADDPEYQTKLAAMNDSLFTGSQYAPGTSLSPLQELMDANLDGKLTRGEMNNYKSMQAIKAENAQIDASESAMNFTNLQKEEWIKNLSIRDLLFQQQVQSGQQAIDLNQSKIDEDQWDKDVRTSSSLFSETKLPKYASGTGDKWYDSTNFMRSILGRQDYNVEVSTLAKNRTSTINKWAEENNTGGMSKSVAIQAASNRYDKLAQERVGETYLYLLTNFGEVAANKYRAHANSLGLSLPQQFNQSFNQSNQVQMPQRQQY